MSITTKLQQVKDDDGAGNKQSLAWLDAIDAGKDVDGISAEHSKHPHVDIVENTCRGPQVAALNSRTTQFSLH